MDNIAISGTGFYKVAIRPEEAGYYKMRFLGAEKVSNGDFSAWTSGVPDGYAIINKGAEDVVSQVGNAIRLVENLPYTPALAIDKYGILSIGQSYVVSINITNFISGKIGIYNGATLLKTISKTQGNGIYKVKVTATELWLRVQCLDTTTYTDVTFTDLSVKPFASDSENYIIVEDSCVDDIRLKWLGEEGIYKHGTFSKYLTDSRTSKEGEFIEVLNNSLSTAKASSSLIYKNSQRSFKLVKTSVPKEIYKLYLDLAKSPKVYINLGSLIADRWVECGVKWTPKELTKKNFHDIQIEVTPPADFIQRL